MKSTPEIQVEAPHVVKNTRSARAKHGTILVALSLLEIGGRACSTLIAQPLKHVAGPATSLNLPMMHATLETASFPLSMMAWIVVSLYTKGTLRIKNFKYRMNMYALMAGLDCISCLSGSMGLNALPATIFTILGSSAIVWSIILTRIFTKKKFTIWHYLSVVMTFASVLLLFITLIEDEGSSMLPASDNIEVLSARTVSPPVAFLCCLLSAFLIALLGVLNYVFFCHEKLKYCLATIVENNAMQSMFVFFFLMPFVAANGEARQWPTVLEKVSSNGSMSRFIGICIGIALGRPVTLFSSVATTAFSSAVLTRALGGPRRLLVMSISFFVFKEPMPAVKVVSGTLMCIATVIYVYGGVILQSKEDADERQLAAVKRTEDIELQQ